MFIFTRVIYCKIFTSLLNPFSLRLNIALLGLFWNNKSIQHVDTHSLKKSNPHILILQISLTHSGCGWTSSVIHRVLFMPTPFRRMPSLTSLFPYLKYKQNFVWLSWTERTVCTLCIDCSGVCITITRPSRLVVAFVWSGNFPNNFIRIDVKNGACFSDTSSYLQLVSYYVIAFKKQLGGPNWIRYLCCIYVVVPPSCAVFFFFYKVRLIYNT